MRERGDINVNRWLIAAWLLAISSPALAWCTVDGVKYPDFSTVCVTGKDPESAEAKHQAKSASPCTHTLDEAQADYAKQIDTVGGKFLDSRDALLEQNRKDYERLCKLDIDDSGLMDVFHDEERKFYPSYSVIIVNYDVAARAYLARKAFQGLAR